MKKLALTIGCVAAFASVALAQGTVNWSGIAGNFIAQTNSTTYSTLVGTTPGQATGGGAAGPTVSGGTGQLYYYQLLFTAFSGSQAAAPTSLAALNTWTALSGATATNGVSGNGRIIQQNPSTGFGTPNSWSAGVTNSIMLVGWSANLGTDYATVLAKLNSWSSSFVANAFFGESVTGYIAAGSGNPGPTLFNASPNASGLPINSITSPAQLLLLGPVSVPEPGTMALAAIGGASLLLFRRRK